MLPTINFREIRQHESSQQRAWEELSYILAPDIEGLPAGTRLERRSAPDGGVEFSCPAPPGAGTGRWAWQAKYLFDLTRDSSWRQMDESVADALAATTDLSRYTFVLPVDRTAGRRGLNQMQKWAQRAETWSQQARARGVDVAFTYVGHSQVLGTLQQDNQAGVIRYFFQKEFLTGGFFRSQVEREVANLGERYMPEVDVELEVKDFIDAACRTPAFQARIREGLADLRRRETDALDNGLTETAVQAHLDKGARAVKEVLDMGAGAATGILDPREALAPLQKAIVRAQAAVKAAEDSAHDATRTLTRTTGDGRVRRRRRPPPARSGRDVHARPDAGLERLYRVQVALARVQDCLDRLSALVGGRQGRLAEWPALVVDGPAGCGKSHLLAAAALERVKQELPTLLLLGQNLVAGGAVWPQVTAAVDLDLTGGELLDALEVAARVRGSGRALIVIDALNEGGGADLWPAALPGLLKDISSREWVAVVLTVRDTFEREVLPAGPVTDRLVRVTHPGLAGHEEEALALYAAHFNLQLPDLPPLLPELSNPLFLRSLCSAVKSSGLTAIPRDAQSLTWVFEGMLRYINESLSAKRRLDVDPADDLVGRAVRSIASALLDASAEVLPLDDARAICEALLPGRTKSKSLFEGLVAEGILTREVSRNASLTEPRIERVRMTYQRLADHLRAAMILDRHGDDVKLRAMILGLMAGNEAWKNLGLLEALALAVPEARSLELPVLLRLGPRAPKRKGVRRVSGDFRKEWLRHELARSFLASLPWRNPSSFTRTTRRLINSYLDSGQISGDEWVGTLVTLACSPGHPLNASFLHKALRKMKMPARDLAWSQPVLTVWSADPNPVARTVEWAWSGILPESDEVAELAATLMIWFFTSPNRRLRDSATKAAVRILDGRTAIVAKLVESFADVDDPYVLERILAVVYGHMLRHRVTPPDRQLLTTMSAAIQKVAQPGPLLDHLLVRWYASESIRLASDAPSTTPVEPAAAPGRYRSSWPLSAPPLTRVAELYGRTEKKYLFSATELGIDFEKYLLDRGLVSAFALPEQERLRRARQAALTRQINMLTSEIIAAVPASRRPRFAQDVDAGLALQWRRTNRVSARVRTMLEDLSHLEHRRRSLAREIIGPDGQLLGRWIAMRVLGLGWNRERFESIDRMLQRARDWHAESERFGKKYAWIAFDEVAGHLADHCSIANPYEEPPVQAYQDPWQVPYVTDIDPSATLRGDEPPSDSSAGRLRISRLKAERAEEKWWMQGYKNRVNSAGEHQGWILDPADIPEPGELITCTDPNGEEWLVLESHATWKVEDPGETLWNRERRHLWVRTQANLIQASDAKGVERWARRQHWMGLWMPTPSESSAGPIGCYPDLAPWPRQLALVAAEVRQRDGVDVPAGWQIAGNGAGTFPMALATTDYHRDGDRDFSSLDLPRGILPAALVVDLLGARWSGCNVTGALALGLGPTESHYSWVADDELVAFSSAGREYGSPMMLCVRASPLRNALAHANLALWTWVLGEKVFWESGEPSHNRSELSCSFGLGPTSTTPWGREFAHVSWRGGTEVRRRLHFPESSA